MVKMKDYYRQSNRRRRKISPALIVVGFLTLILISVRFIYPGLMEDGARALALPFWQGQNRVGASVETFFSSLRTKGSLYNENKALKRALSRTEALTLYNRALDDENRTLKELLGRRRFEHLVLTPILKRPNATLYDTLIIGIGANENGISTGDRVVVLGSIVVGTVSSISGKTAVVTLFSTPGIETDALIGASSTSAVARGVGAGNFVVKLPKEVKVSVGDIVTFPGFSTLVFGEVASVESKPSDAFAIVRFLSPISVNSLRFVEVLTDKNENPSIIESPKSEEAPALESSKI